MTVVLLLATYPLLWFPAVLDAWRGGQESSWIDGDSVGYVLWMLFVLGPLALPLLWQSRAVPRPAKWILSALVCAVAFSAILLLVWLGPLLERLLPGLLEMLQGM